MAERITPKDFATGAPPRIMGTEAEDHVSLRTYKWKARFAEDEDAFESDLNTRLSEECAAMSTLLSKKTFKRAGIDLYQDKHLEEDEEIGDSKWLANGQKMYIDCGEVLESCTAESLGPKQTLAATLAGIKVLGKLAEASKLPVRIFRRSATVNESGYIETSAFHMNHITPDDNIGFAYDEYHNRSMRAHAATRLFTWGGMVVTVGYSLAQKAMDLDYFYIYKDEGHGFRRIEDYSGEQSSPWGTFMAMATTSVLFRILEHPEQKDLNKRFAALALDDPHEAIEVVARDETFNERLLLDDGRMLTAIQIQTELADIASEVGRRFKLPEDEQYAVDQWQLVCKDLKEASQTGDIKPLASRIGWASKKLWLERKNIGPLQADNPEAVLFDMSWDCIYPQEGGRLQYPKRTGLTIATDEEVIALVDKPPQSTRAVVRSRYLEDPSVDVTAISWGALRTSATKNSVISLHPYQTRRGRLH